MLRESACNAKCSAATTRTVARSRSMAQCHFARAPLTPVLVPLVCLLRPRTHPNDLPSPCVSGVERTIPHPPSSLLLSAGSPSLVPCCVFCISPLRFLPFALSLFRSRESCLDITLRIPYLSLTPLLEGVSDRYSLSFCFMHPASEIFISILAMPFVVVPYSLLSLLAGSFPLCIDVLILRIS